MKIPKTLKYVLDSDTFIRAARTHYPFDFARPFWDGLLKFAGQGIICSIDKVYDELIQGNDELAEWSKKHFSSYFLNTESKDLLANYTTIINWAQDQTQYTQRAKDEFYEQKNADTWLISLAFTSELTIVTHEIQNQDIRRKIPIPNVCDVFEIRYIDVYQMLRDLEFKF